MPNKTLEKWKEKTLKDLCEIEIGKTPNKDAKAEKMTYVTCFGLEEATKKLQQHVKNACDILNNSDFKSEILFNITLGLEEKILKRINK